MAELWVTLGKRPEESSGGVLRACAMTLAVLMEEGDDAAAVGESLARLMRDHPSRAIVIVVPESREPRLEAQVLAQCWMPFGKREQICCEQIRITASEASLGELPPVLLPLAAPDLPTYLWCRSARLFRLPVFPALARMAGKTIIDSSAFDGAAAILAELAGRQGTRPAADLAWTRLTSWRELIAQSFENRGHFACLQSISRIRMIYGGQRIATGGFYLAAWLNSGLEKTGGRARVEFVRAGDDEPGTVRGVELIAGEATAGSFAVTQTKAGALELRIGDVTSQTAFEPPTDYLLLREELSLCGRDSVFEEVLPRAAALAAGEISAGVIPR